MSLTRDLTTVGGGTLMSRLFGFARDTGIAALLGTGPFSEALFAVLQVINFFRRLLAEGALNSAFVPIWLKLRNGEDGEANADRFTRRSLLAMLFITSLASLLVFVFTKPLIAAIAPGFDFSKQMIAGVLLTIASPYIFVLGLVAVLASALNAERRVVAVTVSTATFNVVMVAAVAMLFDERFDAFERAGTLAGAIVVAALVQLVITGLTWLLTGKRWRRGSVRVADQTAVFFARVLPGVIAAGIPQLKLIAAAAIVSSSPAAVAWLYYANRLYELPLGIASVAIAAVIVPRIAASLRDGDVQTSEAAQSDAVAIALGVALPAATGLAVLATPISAGLFQHGAFTAQDTAAVAAALTAICAGLPGHVLEKVLGAISFAHEDTHTPMLAALCGLAVAVVGALLLFPRYGYVGAAAAIALSAWVGTSLLIVVLLWRGWLYFYDAGARRVRRIVWATIVMGLVVTSAHIGWQRLYPAFQATPLGQIVALAVLVPFGILIYGGALQILGVVKLKDLIGALRG